MHSLCVCIRVWECDCSVLNAHKAAAMHLLNMQMPPNVSWVAVQLAIVVLHRTCALCPMPVTV